MKRRLNERKFGLFFIIVMSFILSVTFFMEGFQKNVYAEGNNPQNNTLHYIQEIEYLEELIVIIYNDGIVETYNLVEEKQTVENNIQKTTIVNLVENNSPSTSTIVTLEPNKIENNEKQKVEDDLYLLAKIIACEYRSQKEEDLDKKIAVGLVILNRVKSKAFPNTIKEVIFQRNQFQPTFDGTWEKVEPTAFDYKAARLAFDNVLVKGEEGSNINKALYFLNPEISEQDNVEWFRRNLEYVGKVGEHEFYTEFTFN